MSADWKEVFYHGHEEKRAGMWGMRLADKLERFPVEGGWLYRCTIQANGKPDVMSMTFVPTSKEGEGNG